LTEPPGASGRLIAETSRRDGRAAWSRGAADVGLILILEEGDIAPWMYFGAEAVLIWQHGGVELGLQSRWRMWTGVVQVGLMGGTRF